MFSLFLSPCWADLTDSRTQLDKIKNRIDHAESALKNKKKTEIKISRELAMINKSLDHIGQNINELKAALKTLKRDISQQIKLLKQSKKDVGKVNLQLEKRLVALYKEGETGPLKIIFSADSPTEMAQQYHYLSRVLEYDKDLLGQYRLANQQQQKHLVGLETLKKQQSDLLDTAKQQQSVAERGRKIQSRLLRQARGDKKQLSVELSQLKENAARLKALIGRIKKEPEPLRGPAVGHFAVGRGKLDWPINGRVIISFGKQKDAKLGTYYESNGIEIAASQGSPIRAVASGKVVFADYFKGYGNLIILNHPGNYHTLYAQTDRMQKKIGSIVSAGDLLGYSGLGGRDSMYFEIRSKGSPVNPLTWLRRR